MEKYLPPYKPWLIPAACSMIFVKCMILLSAHARQTALLNLLEVDYLSHWVVSPLDRLDNLDAILFWGIQIIYWGLEMILFAVFYNTEQEPAHPGQIVSKIGIFLSTGLMVKYGLLVWCAWTLAAYEGYHPMTDTLQRINHGPWHSLSHLSFMVLWQLIILLMAMVLAMGAFFIQFNRQAFVLFVFGIILLFFHIHTQLWLID